MAKIGVRAPADRPPGAVRAGPTPRPSWRTAPAPRAASPDAAARPGSPPSCARRSLEGAYAHGEKLPAERQLAEAFGASRTTVRIALDQLEDGASASPAGSAAAPSSTYRSRGETEDIAEITSPLELIEVRLGVEPHMVRLAVLNATARDIDRLAGIDGTHGARAASTPRASPCSTSNSTCSSPKRTHNPLMVWIYRQINDVRSHCQWNAMKDKVLTPRTDRRIQPAASRPLRGDPHPRRRRRRWPSSPTTCTTPAASSWARIRNRRGRQEARWQPALRRPCRYSSITAFNRSRPKLGKWPPCTTWTGSRSSRSIDAS